MAATTKTAAKKSNELNEQCYCLKSRIFDKVELQCSQCATWFHLECIEIDPGPLVRFMISYQFTCKKCSTNNQENFIKKQASFHQLCLTTIANLTYENKNHDSPRQLFSKDRDIIPFIDKNWEALTCAPRRTKSTWHATISRSMTREDVFQTKIENSEPLHGLRDLNFEKIGPFNETNKLILGSSRLGNDGRQNSEQNNSTGGGGGGSKRGAKRKANDSSYNNAYNSNGNHTSTKKKGLNDLNKLEKLVPTCYPLDHPNNKDGYRYHLVEPDPHSPIRQKFEETEYWAGKPLPGNLYRLFLEDKVVLALHDRGLQLKLSEDRLSVTGDKGYSMIRATHGVSHGSWYFEVVVNSKPIKAALRLGWAQPLANLQAPCGYDKFSYSWRSRKGTVFHESIGKSYSRLVESSENESENNNNNNSDYGAGDVLGFHIYLPLGNLENLLPENCKKMTLVKFKNHLYYEEKDNFKEAESRLKPLIGSKITFYKNGVCHGIAYKDIYEGVYYPAVSIYKNSNVTMNFGPDFKFPIDDKQVQPISDLVVNKFIEHTMSDLVYHVTHEEDSIET